jgi:hypothetical protein
MIFFVRAEATIGVAVLPDLLPLEGVRVCLWRLGRGRRQRALGPPADLLHSMVRPAMWLTD